MQSLNSIFSSFKDKIFVSSSIIILFASLIEVFKSS